MGVMENVVVETWASWKTQASLTSMRHGEIRLVKLLHGKSDNASWTDVRHRLIGGKEINASRK